MFHLLITLIIGLSSFTARAADITAANKDAVLAAADAKTVETYKALGTIKPLDLTMTGRHQSGCEVLTPNTVECTITDAFEDVGWVEGITIVWLVDVKYGQTTAEVSEIELRFMSMTRIEH